MRGLPPRLLIILVLLSPAAGVAQDPHGNLPWFVEGDVACPRIALIFTTGAEGPPSESILNTLIERRVPATMFATGTFARSYPEYLRHLDRVGFQIGSRSDMDLPLTGASDEAIRSGIRSSVDANEAAIGRPADPYHALQADEDQARVHEIVADEGLLPVGWRVSATDLSAEVTEESVYNAVAYGAYPGAIVEMHLDGPVTDRSTALALPRLIDDLRARGFGFVTIGGMLEPCTAATPGTPESVTMVGLDVHGLHCKTAPSPGAAMLRLLLNGDVVTIRGPAFDGWLPVECAGHDGWVRADVVSRFGKP